MKQPWRLSGQQRRITMRMWRRLYEEKGSDQLCQMLMTRQEKRGLRNEHWIWNMEVTGDSVEQFE